jgi:protein-tyrosine phosphatase
MVKYKRLPMETLVNTRDLGGYAAEGGKITKYGVYLRTDCPIGISEKDIQTLVDYGVTLSIDLRGTDEVEKTPSGMIGVPGHTYRHMPINEDHQIIKGDGKKRTGPPPPPKNMENFDLGDSYIGFLEEGKDWVRKVITLCAEWEGCVMFHCFIGKDRAGTIAGLILGAVGVGMTDILMDYSASMSCLRPKYDKMGATFLPQKRGRPDYSWGFFGSVPESMEAVWYYIQEKYGGYTAYLKSCGVTDETLQKLKDKLLEDPAD